MALWNRLNQSRLKLLSYQFKTYYFQLPYASSLHFIPITPKPHNPCGIHKFSHNIRFFASLQQVNNANGPRLNHQIEARYIRLVTDEGHKVVSTREALEQARRLKLDLVEVQRNSDPPVCKMMDFHKEKYKQKVKEKDRAKSKSDVTLKKGECKEIRFSGKTEHKDLKMKADMVKKLMERGYRVKCVALGQKKRVSRKPFPKQVSTDDESTEGLGDDEATLERKEQEELEQELLGVLSQLTTLIEDVTVVESGPRVAKRQAYVIVKHVKFGSSKKGGAKKSNNIQTTQAAAKASGTLDEDAAESGDESEGQLSADENDLPGEYHYTGRTPLSADSTHGTKTTSINFVKNGVELEADHRNFNTSNLSHLRPVHDSKRADRVPPSTQKPLDEHENRYRRVERKAGFSQISRDSTPSDRRDSFSYDQRFSTERAQPRAGINVSPSIGERRTTGNYSSSLRNTNLHPNEVRKPEVERPSPSYGIFSPQNRSSPSSTEGTGANPNSPSSRVDNGQRKWGIFSRDSPHGASKLN